MATNALMQRSSVMARRVHTTSSPCVRFTRLYSSRPLVDKYALPAASEQKSQAVILNAIRSRNPNTIWKKYNDLEASNQLNSLTSELHSLTLRSIKPKNSKAYSEAELAVVKDRLFHVYDKMKASNIPIDVRDYNHMLNFFGRARDYATCGRLWQEMTRTTTPNVYSYNLYMYAAVRSGQTSKAFDTLKEMREANVEPNLFTYDTLLKAHGSSGDLVKMDKLFADIFIKPNKSQGVTRPSFLSSIATSPTPKPSSTTFTALLDAHGSKGNVDGMMHIYQNMMPSFAVKCDLQAYNTIIRWCCHHGQVGVAKKIFFDMERAGVKPNVVTFNYLVKHEALKQGRAGAAHQMMQLMQRIYNIRPIQSMYHALIKAHTKRNRTDAAVDLYKEWQTGQMGTITHRS